MVTTLCALAKVSLRGDSRKGSPSKIAQTSGYAPKSATVGFAGIHALQKGIALSIRLAIPFCNAYRLRVSTDDQDTSAQVGVGRLPRASVSIVRRPLADLGSGPELHRLPDQLRESDMLIYGSSTGSRDPFRTCSPLWSGLDALARTEMALVDRSIKVRIGRNLR